MMRVGDELNQLESMQRDGRVHGARVVVAEDDPAMRSMVVSTLLGGGYEVHAASTGDELLDLLGSIVLQASPADGIDLLILDNRMPGYFGLDVVRSMRLSRWRTPVILMTAFPDPTLAAEAARLQVALLAKPFSLHTLSRAAITAILRPTQRQGES
jgi:CheY-like chemotaxis protein